MPDVGAVDDDGALVGRVEAAEQLAERRLARGDAPDDAHPLARRDPERQAVERFGLLAAIGEFEVADLQPAAVDAAAAVGRGLVVAVEPHHRG